MARITIRIVLLTLLLLSLPGSFALAEFRTPRSTHELPDHDLVNQFRLHKGCGRTEGARPQHSREPEEMTRYDVTRYEVELEIYTEDNFITGQVLMEFDCSAEQLDTLLFHAGGNVTLHEVLQAGTPLDFTRDGEFVSALLDDPLGEGESSSLEISYTADNQGNQGMMYASGYNVQLQQEIAIRSTQSEPFDARHWWPCKDDTRDKANTTLISVRTETYNEVVSNGILLSDTHHGDGTHTVVWEEQWPMVTYLVSVCVAPYNHIEDVWEWEEYSMPMHDWSWSFYIYDQQQWIDLGIDALNALSDIFGCYPFVDEKYGHAEYTWGGAMEHQTCSSMGFYNDWVIAHELAHQWFGDKLTCDTFHHIWLNEGWASYSEALFFEYYLGESALHSYMSGEAYWGGGTIWIEDPETENIFDGNLSYRKASWVNHMLRHVVGDDNFFEATRNYLGPNEPEYHRTVTTDEYRGFMEEASGMDLEYFFDQWIFGEYYPEYAYFWAVEPAGDNYQLNVNLLQEQQPQRQTFTMPIDLVVELPFSPDTTIRLWNDASAQRYEILFELEPQDVALDPDRWILREVTELTDVSANFNLPWGRFENSDGEEVPYLPSNSDFQLRSVIRNTGHDHDQVTVTLLCTNDAVTIDTEPLELGELNFAAYSDTLLFEGSVGPVESEAGEFTLQVDADGEIFEFEIEIFLGNPNLLLVDDDGGDDYETWLQAALEEWSFYHLLEPAALDGDLLAASELVIWMQGDQSRELTVGEQDLLSDYVGGGGHLVLTGQHFAAAQSADWLEQFCGLELLQTDYYDQTIWGDDGSYLEGEGLFLMGGGAGNQSDLERFSPLGDNAQPLLHYFTDQTPGNAAVINQPAGEGAVATFGFGWEGVAPTGIGMRLHELAQATWDWALGLQSTPLPPVLPETIAITATYPNPFNPSLNINYYLPQPGVTKLTVYNLLGEEVGTIFDKWCAEGSGQLSWTASNLASGLYFLQLQQGAQLQTARVMLLK